MRALLFFFLITISSSLWAQIETEKTVTMVTTAKDTDEAKPYLLHSATLETIKQYSTEIGIDYSALEKILNAKFETWFEAFKSRSLAEKFGKNYSKELSDEQKKTFLEGLDSRRDEEFVRFAKLDQLLDTYGFKQIAKDVAIANQWKATVVLNLNKIRLERFNSRLMSQEAKLYSKIYIVSDINLLGMAWTDLSLDKSTTFTDPMMTSWNKWLSSNLPMNVEEVVVCSGACTERFNSWQQLSQEEGMQIPEDIINSLWVKVSFNLRKVTHAKEINEWKFEWDGSVILLDSNTKKLIASYTLQPETKTWRGLEQKVLNSALASSMYKAPLDAFTKITRKVQDNPRLNRLSRLVIIGHQHLGDVLLLMETLKKTGTKLNFEVQLDVFSQKEAQLLCFYQGEEKSFTDLLSELKELKSVHSYRIVNEFTGVHHVLKLIAE